ncbi:hypothetical protein ID866_13143 [Astraeus odoratus]|nr:hypothetical protein ID866_13143 [Astraeus odoratus]
MDDVLGNILKQWNKHCVIYMSNTLLPCKMIQKEYSVHFVTSSPNASLMELMAAFKESVIKANESGVLACDCKMEEEVLLDPYDLFHGGDNPMLTEECSHGGLHCNYYCQTCKVGRTGEYKCSDKGYESLFKEGMPCALEDTFNEIHWQIHLLIEPGAADKLKKAVADSGVHDSLSANILSHVVQLGKNLWAHNGTLRKPEEEIWHILEKELEDSLVDERVNLLIGMRGELLPVTTT